MAIREKMIDRDFAESLLKTFDDPYKNGVHILFNEWWQYADESTKNSYVAQMTETGEFENLTNGAQIFSHLTNKAGNQSAFV